MSKQLTDFEKEIVTDLCRCTDSRQNFSAMLRASMLLVKLHYANPLNINDPSIACYANGGSSQIDVRLSRTSSKKKPDDFPAIIVMGKSVNYARIALNNRMSVSRATDREVIVYEARGGILFRHISPNDADLIPLAEQTAGLFEALGWPMLREMGAGRLTLNSITETGKKELPVADHFGVDLLFDLEYSHALVRTQESHRIAGFFTNISTDHELPST